MSLKILMNVLSYIPIKLCDKHNILTTAGISVRACACVCMRVCMRAYVRVHACVRACVHACMRACACVRASASACATVRECVQPLLVCSACSAGA